MTQDTATHSLNAPLKIVYFSDILCVWAYFAQVRLDELKAQFGDAIELDYAFIPLFGDTAGKIGVGWAERGGFEGFNRHINEVAARFDHIEINPNLWLSVRPASSAPPHLFLKAVDLWAQENGIAEEGGHSPLERAAWELRRAFFEEGRDIAEYRIQMEVAEKIGLPVAGIEKMIENGRAFAALCADTEARDKFRIDGSPTFLMSEGRQKLYGNVGYRVIEAVVQELLRAPDMTQASWC